MAKKVTLISVKRKSSEKLDPEEIVYGSHTGDFVMLSDTPAVPAGTGPVGYSRSYRSQAEYWVQFVKDGKTLSRTGRLTITNQSRKPAKEIWPELYK